MLLQYIHIIFFPHEAICFVKCTSPSCNKAPPQHDAATPVLHGWDGVLQTWRWSLWPNGSIFVSSDQRTFLQKVQSLSPSAVANRGLSFLLRFWSSGFFLAKRPFGLYRYRTPFTVDIDTCTCFLQHLHKVLCCCSGIGLYFSHQSMFISRRQNASPSWSVWRMRGPMVFILAYYCLYRWTWYLKAFGNGPQGWTRLVEVYNNFFWGLGWFL
jgi:hypothetical protein